MDDWLRSPTNPPIYSGELVRKRHWLDPVSTWLRWSTGPTEEDLYLNPKTNDPLKQP